MHLTTTTFINFGVLGSEATFTTCMAKYDMTVKMTGHMKIHEEWEFMKNKDNEKQAWYHQEDNRDNKKVHDEYSRVRFILQKYTLYPWNYHYLLVF